MHCLKTTTQYEITIASSKSYHKKFIIIQSLNTRLQNYTLKTFLMIQIYLHHIFFA
jgi:hypothetical protein